MNRTKQEWLTTPLCNIAEIERTAVLPENIKSGTSYVGLENITSSGKFVGVGEVANGDLASTKFAFTNKHILYGKLRPYLAKIARPDFCGVCSTDILPILPGPNMDRSFLLHYLRQPQMVEYASSRTSGANLPRLSPKTLAEFEIPFPPLSEQKRIADILDKADAIRRKRQEAIESLDAMRQAALYDTVLSSKTKDDWREERLGDIADVKGGIALSSRRSELEGHVPYLRVANVFRDRLDLAEIKEIGLTNAEFERAKLLVGDVLIVEGHGNRDEIGRSAIWDGSIADCVHQNHLIRVRPNDALVRPVYLSAFINSPLGRRQLFRFGKTTSGLNTISLSNVRDTVILLPPLALQQRMEKAIEETTRLLTPLNAASSHATDLFNSLAQRAFNGEL